MPSSTLTSKKQSPATQQNMTKPMRTARKSMGGRPFITSLTKIQNHSLQRPTNATVKNNVGGKYAHDEQYYENCGEILGNSHSCPNSYVNSYNQWGNRPYVPTLLRTSPGESFTSEPWVITQTLLHSTSYHTSQNTTRRKFMPTHPARQVVFLYPHPSTVEEM